MRSPRWYRWYRLTGWAVGVWLMVWALAYAAVPVVLRSQLQKIGSEQLGRQVSVGAVDFKPWSLELTLHDIAISRVAVAGTPPPAGQTPQLHIRRI